MSAFSRGRCFCLSGTKRPERLLCCLNPIDGYLLCMKGLRLSCRTCLPGVDSTVGLFEDRSYQSVFLNMRLSTIAYPLEFWKKKAAVVAARKSRVTCLLRRGVFSKLHKYVTAILYELKIKSSIYSGYFDGFILCSINSVFHKLQRPENRRFSGRQCAKIAKNTLHPLRHHFVFHTDLVDQYLM